MQQQDEQVSASERSELTLQYDEAKRVKIELQQQREQQERQIEQMKPQQISDIARRMSSNSVKWPRSENSKSLSLHRKESVKNMR